MDGSDAWMCNKNSGDRWIEWIMDGWMIVRRDEGKREGRNRASTPWSKSGYNTQAQNASISISSGLGISRVTTLGVKEATGRDG